MDQGPMEMPEPRGWTRADALELARSVAIQLVVAVTLAVGAALVWGAASERPFREALTVTSLVTAAALPILGTIGQVHDAHLGLDAPHAMKQSRGDGDGLLTPLGVMLFVSLPVAAAGMWLGA